jgi:TM2 domain-containing membrane protein YozV
MKRLQIPTLSVLMLSVLSTIASADGIQDPEARQEIEAIEGAAAPIPSVVSFPVPLQPEFRPVKSYGAAYLWMFGATILPIVGGSMLAASPGSEGLAAALILSGIFVGPSAGQFYAGSVGAGLVATGLRVAGGGLMLVGLIQAIGCSWGDGPCNAGEAEALVGLLVFGGGTLYSLIDTKFAVDRANEKARKTSGIKASFAPALYPTREGRLIPGLAMSASF